MKTISGMSLNNPLKCEKMVCFFYDPACGHIWALGQTGRQLLPAHRQMGGLKWELQLLENVGKQGMCQELCFFVFF